MKTFWNPSTVDKVRARALDCFILRPLRFRKEAGGRIVTETISRKVHLIGRRQLISTGGNKFWLSFFLIVKISTVYVRT